MCNIIRALFSLFAKKKEHCKALYSLPSDLAGDYEARCTMNRMPLHILLLLFMSVTFLRNHFIAKIKYILNHEKSSMVKKSFETAQHYNKSNGARKAKYFRFSHEYLHRISAFEFLLFFCFFSVNREEIFAEITFDES